MNKFVIGSLILLCLLPFRLLAQTEVQTITAPEVKGILDNNGGLVIHVLSEMEFAVQHIPGTINIPIHQLAESDKLPADLNTPLVFYCMGHR
ncbi:MAG: rhodanese-like domain-containing protein [Desulfobulbaceae bacterium]|jgi:rhodanese-related sulfurtransferase